MTVTGVVKGMSAESAQRAALGAGAIIIDVIAVDDDRKEYQRVESLRQLRPDMILMSGGTDGGNVDRVVEMARCWWPPIRSRAWAGPEPAVIYAGNRDAYAAVADLIADRVSLRQVENLRPTLEVETCSRRVRRSTNCSSNMSCSRRPDTASSRHGPVRASCPRPTLWARSWRP